MVFQKTLPIENVEAFRVLARSKQPSFAVAGDSADRKNVSGKGGESAGWKISGAEGSPPGHQSHEHAQAGQARHKRKHIKSESGETAKKRQGQATKVRAQIC